MNAEFSIRTETAADIDVITAVTIAAFKDLSVSHQTEHFIVQAPRFGGLRPQGSVHFHDGFGAVA